MKPVPSIADLVFVTREAGRIIDKHFGEFHAVSEKADATPVTAVDTFINDLFACSIEVYPDVGFIGEEGNGADKDDWVLYVDPLDGTGAFTRGMATSTIAVSLMYRGTPVIAVIHNPVTGQLWFAEKDRGCGYLRNNLVPKNVQILKDPPKPWRTAICLWPGIDRPFADFQKKVLESPDFSDQQMGAFALGGRLIASGLLHATACSSGSAVEAAAMSLIVREAGGVAIDLRGNSLDSFHRGYIKGKDDFTLFHGAIFACNKEVAGMLFSLYGHY